MLSRAIHTENLRALQRAVLLLRRAVVSSDVADADRLTHLSNLAAALQTLFRQTGNLDDLNDAIEAGRAAAQTDDDPATALSNLGMSLRMRYKITGSQTDLRQAVEAGRAAMAVSEDDPERFFYKSGLAGALLARFENTGDEQDVAEAINLIQAAIVELPDGHLERPAYLSNLSTALLARYKRMGDITDLTLAIESARASLREVRPGHPEYPRELVNLGMALKTRYERLGKSEDINEAIDILQEAVTVAQPTNPDRVEYLSSLGNALKGRYERTGDDSDIARSLKAHDIALRMTPEGHGARILIQTNAGNAHSARFHQTGDRVDLSEAIELLRKALAGTSADDADRALRLNNLGDSLRVRYVLYEEAGDLLEALAMLEFAVGLTAKGHPDHALFLYNLALAQWSRFAFGENARTAPADQERYLDAAIATARQAAAAMPTDYHDSSRVMVHLCFALQRQYEHTRDSDDLSEAITFGRAAKQRVNLHHPEYADCLSTLGTALQLQAERTNDLDTLGEAIELGQAAVRAAPANHPSRANYLSELGTALETNFLWTGNVEALSDSLDVWKEAASARSSSTDVRMTAAVRWGRLAAEQGLPAEAEAGFASAIDLLPLVAWHGMQPSTRLERLSRWAGLPSDAAASAINAGHIELAVSILEKGRSILWSQRLGLRTELDDLAHEHADLARALYTAKAALDQREGLSIPTTLSGAEQMAALAHERDHRLDAANEWDRIIAQIREMPGFESFLVFPTVNELGRAAGNDTVVVINVSHYRCDALAVSNAGVQLIPLPSLEAHNVALQAQRLLRAIQQLTTMDLPATQYRAEATKISAVVDDVLEWLWDSVAKPVLDGLSFTTARTDDVELWPRLWWCPTGALTVFPIHAAARRNGKVTAAVLDRVVSSYIPSLTAWVRSDLPPSTSQRSQALLVAMPVTAYLPGEAPLPYATREIEFVAANFRGLHTLRIGKGATRQAILTDLATHAIAHFACHGGVDLGAPLESGLCLADGRLTIDDVVHSGASHIAHFAFLSSCHSGAAHMMLLDEQINIAAAMQLAGFRHVIATLWAIKDRRATEIASDVYRMISDEPEGSNLGGRRIAEALHGAICKQRNRGRPAHEWAPFTHTG